MSVSHMMTGYKKHTAPCIDILQLCVGIALISITRKEDSLSPFVKTQPYWAMLWIVQKGNTQYLLTHIPLFFFPLMILVIILWACLYSAVYFSCSVYSLRSFQVLILHSIWHFAIKPACMLHRALAVIWWITRVKRWGQRPKPLFSWTKEKRQSGAL